MPNQIDIISIGEQNSTKGLLPEVKRVFGGKGVSIFRIKTPLEYPNRKPNIYAGAVIFNFDDGNISRSPNYQKKLQRTVKGLRQRFPSAPIALRSSKFDPITCPNHQENELAWRLHADFDFALAKTAPQEYVGELLKNAFNRYNSLPFGATILNLPEGVLQYNGRNISFSSGKLDTFLVLAKQPWIYRNIDEIHRSHITPTGTVDGTRKRIYLIRKALEGANFPNFIETNPRHGIKFSPLPKSSLSL